MGRNGLTALVEGHAALADPKVSSKLSLGHRQSLADVWKRDHATNISRPDCSCQQSDCLRNTSRPNMVRRMPAKALSDEQLRDAKRLRMAYELWRDVRKERGEPVAQDAIAKELFGFGQSALSQYLNGEIPLNAAALATFSRVLGVAASNISPSIVRQQNELAALLSSPPEVMDVPHSDSLRKRNGTVG